MNNIQLARRIEKELRPDEGWYKRDTGETVFSTCLMLLEYLSEEQVSYIVGELIGCVRNEYGD